VSTILDRERGRSDGAHDLGLRVGDAPAGYLDGALDNPSLGPEEVALLLRNRAATAEMIVRVARRRALTLVREVRVGIVRNPRTPLVLARRFLPHLFWADVADAASDLRLSPVLRRDAEKLLRLRLPELALGERIALARRGSRGIVEILREEADAGVLRALAGNPRITEADVLRVVGRPDVPASFLAWLADQSSWAQRRAIRLALLRTAGTPPASALRLIPGLSRRDLDDLRHDAGTPRLVRVAADRRLSGSRPEATGASPHFG
jgi:hypothetical protein